MSKIFQHTKTYKRSRLDFFLVKSVKNYIRYGITTAALGAIVIPWTANTFLVDKVKSILQLYRFGKEELVPDHLKERVEKACAAITLSDYEKSYLKTYMYDGFCEFQLGSIWSLDGGWIGIPLNYKYNQLSDIDKLEIRLRRKKVDWNTPQGEILQKSLILTEDEQIFGICQSLLELQSVKLLSDVTLPSITILGIYAAAKSFNERFNLYAHQRVFRVIPYAVITLFGVVAYCLVTDFYHIKRDYDNDKKLGDLGPDWCDAGIRYYTKLIDRNVAMLELSDNIDYTNEGLYLQTIYLRLKEWQQIGLYYYAKYLNRNITIRELSGDRYFTADGNFHNLFRLKGLPLTYRKKCLQEMLKEHQEKKLESHETKQPALAI